MNSAQDNVGSIEEAVSPAAWKRVFHDAYSLVRNKSEAEDLTQDAFVVLFRNRESGRQIEHLGAWMKTVTRHLAYRRFHKLRPDLHVSLDTRDETVDRVMFDPIDPAPSVEKTIIDRTMLLLGAKVLCQFPDQDRRCIMMYFRGHDFLQIATVLGVSRWTARRTTLRALQRLQARVGRSRQ